MPGILFGQTDKAYVGPFNGNWNNAANWSPVGVPASVDNVILGTNSTTFQSGPAVVDFDYSYAGQTLSNLTLDATGVNSSITLRQSSADSAMVALQVYVGNTVGGNFYTQSAGSFNAQLFLVLGNEAGSSGAYTLTGGTFAASNLYVSFSGNGTFTQSGGTITIPSSVGTGNLYVGFIGNGTFTQSGGTNTISNTLYLAAQSGAANGTYTLSGTGVLRATSEHVGEQGTGIFTQSGGTHTVSSMFEVGQDNGSGTFNLDGGTLEVPAISIGVSARVSRFNFNGGTVRARASNANFYPLAPPNVTTAATVKTGGAIFDTNGFDIGVAQPLIHDTDLGCAADGGLVKRGPAL